MNVAPGVIDEEVVKAEEVGKSLDRFVDDVVAVGVEADLGVLVRAAVGACRLVAESKVDGVRIELDGEVSKAVDGDGGGGGSVGLQPGSMVVAT